MLAEAAAGAHVYNHPLGQVCALAAALAWAVALILFKQSGERIAPVALNLFKNAVALVLVVLTLALLVLTGQDSGTFLRDCPPKDLLWLALSGVLGIALADTLFFRGLNLIGVGLVSLVDCCYSPLVILFSWLLLSERLTYVHLGGTVLVVAGLFIVTQHTPPPGRTHAQLLAGILITAAAIALMAFSIVFVKPILEVTPVFWATFVRMAAGSAVLAVFAAVDSDTGRHWSVFFPSLTWKSAIPAAVLGTYVSLVLWVAGFKYTTASVAGVLNQTSVIFASLLAVLFLRERAGARQIAALVLAIMGVLVVTCAEPIELWLAAYG
jgi:drug/metabolite transporter (DMT)-like permease